MWRMQRLLVIAVLVALAMGCASSETIRVKPVDRTKVPGPGEKQSWVAPAVQTWTLNNGLEVWFVEQRHTSLAKVALILPSGYATDPSGKEGLTDVMVDMLNEGAGTRSSLDLTKEFQRLGTDYGTNVDLDTLVLGMDLLPSSFGPSMALLSDIVRSPTFPDAEFERRRDHAVASNLSSEARPTTGRSRAMRHALFGDGYAGFRGKGFAHTLKSISNNDVQAHYKALMAPKGTKIVIVGALSKEEVASGVQAAFGDWAGAPSVAAAKVLSKKISPTVFLVDYPGAQQSAILVATRAQGSDAVTERFPKKLYARVIAGAFTSRINMNLREDKGYTYGARGGFGRYRKVGYFAVGASVKTDTTLASLVEIKRELEQIGSKRPLSAEEFTEAKRGLLLGYPNRFETISSVAGELSGLVESGDSPAVLASWSPSVEAVTQSASQSMAKEFSNIGNYVVVVAGDRARIEESLKSLGLPIVHCGRDGRPMGDAAPTP
jgi:zinc protease